jgi:hypothetical protein
MSGKKTAKAQTDLYMTRIFRAPNKNTGHDARVTWLLVELNSTYERT